MAITLVNLTGDITDLITEDFDARRTKVWIEANVDHIADLDNNVIRLGTSQPKSVNTDGTFTLADLVATGSADTNLDDSADLQYQLWVDYPASPLTGMKRVRKSFGWYAIPTTANVIDLVEAQQLEPTWQSGLDAATAGNVANPASATALALAASYARSLSVLYVDDFAGANDQIKINAAVTAAYALADAGDAHVVLQFQSREYVLSDAPTSPDGDPGPYAQIPLPIRSSSETRLVIEFRGTATTPVAPTGAQTTVQVGGTVLRSTLNTALSGTLGSAAVIGGPSVNGGTTTFSNVSVVLDGICIRRVADPKMMGADFSWCLQASVRNCLFDTNQILADILNVTQWTGIALHMPLLNNNAISELEGTNWFIGSPVALRFGEHITVNHIAIALCGIALAPAPHFHGSIFTHANIEWCKYVIADLNTTTGPIDCTSGGGGASQPAEGGILHFGLLDIEDAVTGNFVPAGAHILDADDVLHVTGRFARIEAGVGTVTGIDIDGGAHIDLHDMMVDEVGGGGGASTIVRASRTAGSVTLNASAGVWANVHTGLDLVIAAAAGDVVELGVSLILGGENVAVHFDFWTIVSGSPLNRLAGEDGVPGWYSIPAVNATPSGTFLYTVQAGDIVGGNVTFRLRFKEASQTDRTLFASAGLPAYVWVKNPA